MSTLSIAKLVLSVLATAALAVVSRRSLAHARTHGFFRFCAWISILALVLLHAEHWFQDPFCSWPGGALQAPILFIPFLL